MGAAGVHAGDSRGARGRAGRPPRPWHRHPAHPRGRAPAPNGPARRRGFVATGIAGIADGGLSVLLSSHVLTELERVADFLVLVSHGSVQVAGAVDDLIASHRVLTGPASEADAYAERQNVVHAQRGEAQAHMLVRIDARTGPVPPGWEAHPVSLEELTLAYLREPSAAWLPGPGALRLEPIEVSN